MKIPYENLTAPREMRAQNIRRTLKAVHLFGHVRHADLARLLWPLSSVESRAAAASKLFGFLVREGYLLKRLNALGSWSYILGQLGANQLSKMGVQGARDGIQVTGIQGGSIFHTTLGTAWLVGQLVAGHDVLSEFAINSNQHEITRGKLMRHWGKLPDGLVIHEVRSDDGRLLHYNVDWLEVESSYKGIKERDRIFDMGWSLGSQLLPGIHYYLDRLILLYAENSRHEFALVQSAVKKWRQSGQNFDDPQSLLGSIILTSADVVVPLGIRSFSQIDLYSYMQRDDRWRALLMNPGEGSV
jgi:hypothetical protein